MATTLVLLLTAYLIAILGASWWIGRGESEEDFLIAGRNRPWWQIAFSKYAVSIGAAYYVTYTAFSYEYGLNVVTLLGGLLIGFLFFAYWGSVRIKRISQAAGGLYTMDAIAEYQTKSKHASSLTNVVVLVTTLLYLTIGVIAGGLLMESLGILSYELAVVLTFTVVVGYVLLSGYKAVVITDVIQGLVMLLLLALVVLGFMDAANVSPTAAFAARPIDILTVAMFTVFGIANAFASPDRYQLSYAGTDERSLKLGFAFAFLPVFVTALILMVVGSTIFLVAPGLDSSLAFTEAMSQFLSPEIVPLALVMFFAGLMSSADTGIYVLASHIESIRGRRLAKGSIRPVIVAIGVLGTLVALAFRDVVDLTILAAGLQISIAFSMMYLVAGGTNATRFLSITYGGLLGVFAGLLYFGLDPKAAAFVLIGNILGFLVSRFLFE